MQAESVSLSVALSFFSALSWVGFDFIRKRLVQQLEPGVAMVVLILGLIPIWLIWGLQQGLNWSENYWLPGLICSAFNVIGQLGFLSAIRLIDFSIGVPILSMTPVFSSLLSATLLGEKLTGVQSAGMFLVVFGAMSLASRTSKEVLFFHRWQGGVWLMAISAVGFSVVSVMDKVCLQHANISSHLLFQALTNLPMMFLFLRSKGLGLPSFKKMQRIWPILGFGLLSVSIAVILQLMAIQAMNPGILEAVKRVVGILASLVIGVLVFKEKFTWRKALSALIIISGVSLILVV